MLLSVYQELLGLEGDDLTQFMPSAGERYGFLIILILDVKNFIDKGYKLRGPRVLKTI